MLLYLHSFAHLLVDAVCAAALFGPVARQAGGAWTFLLYNTLAFSTQCLVGLAADRLRKHRISAALAMLVVAAGFALPLPAPLRVTVVGLGNSVFHVAAGTDVLERSGGRAAPLGIFVAPGAIGVTLGSLFPALGPLLAGLLGLTALVSLWSKEAREAPAEAPCSMGRQEDKPLLTAALLTAAVAVRAIGGSALSFPWQTGTLPVLLTTLFVYAGKTGGGFLCDRMGPARSAWASIPAAALLISFCGAWMLPALLGQFALNLTMPITLWLLYKALPDSPGFAFGLAASALWPGTVTGKYIRLTGPARWALLLGCFLFGLFAVLYALRRLDGAKQTR